MVNISSHILMFFKLVRYLLFAIVLGPTRRFTISTPVHKLIRCLEPFPRKFARPRWQMRIGQLMARTNLNPRGKPASIQKLSSSACLVSRTKWIAVGALDCKRLCTLNSSAPSDSDQRYFDRWPASNDHDPMTSIAYVDATMPADGCTGIGPGIASKIAPWLHHLQKKAHKGLS